MLSSKRRSGEKLRLHNIVGNFERNSKVRVSGVSGTSYGVCEGPGSAPGATLNVETAADGHFRVASSTQRSEPEPEPGPSARSGGPEPHGKIRSSIQRRGQVLGIRGDDQVDNVNLGDPETQKSPYQRQPDILISLLGWPLICPLSVCPLAQRPVRDKPTY